MFAYRMFKKSTLLKHSALLLKEHTVASAMLNSYNPLDLIFSPPIIQIVHVSTFGHSSNAWRLGICMFACWKNTSRLGDLLLRWAPQPTLLKSLLKQQNKLKFSRFHNLMQLEVDSLGNKTKKKCRKYSSSERCLSHTWTKISIMFSIVKQKIRQIFQNTKTQCFKEIFN